MNKIIIFILMLFSISSVFGQSDENTPKDTLKLHGILNLQGRYLSGNLNEFGANILAKASLINSKWYGGVAGSYNYVEVEKFNVMNDFWSSGMVKYGHLNRFYPLGMLYAGFAKSFGIDEAYVGGVGAGVNIIQKSPTKYVNINVIGGYATFNYAQVSDVNDLVTNIFISSNTNIFKNKAEINWEFHAFYLPQTELDVSGIQNNIRLSLPLTKAVSLTLTHQYLYNSYVDVEVSKENSMLLFGLMIKK